MGSDPCLGMHGNPQMGLPQQQQPLPSVSNVMGPPPSQFRSSSYPSQQQPTSAPVHTSSVSSSASPVPVPSGPTRMVPYQNQNKVPMSSMPSAHLSVPPPPPYNVRAAMQIPNPSTVQIPISSTMNMESERLQQQPSTSGIQQPPQLTQKEQYRQLKKRFKFLVYENECYQEELRNLQRKLLKLSRDKNFLLDRLIQYEKLSDSSDDSDSNSVKTVEEKPKPPKKKSRPAAPRRKSGASKPKLGGGPSVKTEVPMSSPSVDLISAEGIKAEPDGSIHYGERCDVPSHSESQSASISPVDCSTQHMVGDHSSISSMSVDSGLKIEH